MCKSRCGTEECLIRYKIRQENKEAGSPSQSGADFSARTNQTRSEAVATAFQPHAQKSGLSLVPVRRVM
ncbi:uncharacterized protein BKA78DRAFT_161652 [Phyllosticta capitalensis]|uniref:uncharacterized protein n=1 Tax=Phyllosticta capitalensis TaxID=121624 RepID=UPI00312DC599